MAFKISLKRAVFILSSLLITVILSACMDPVDIQSFMKDPQVQEVIAAIKETVKIDRANSDPDPNLTEGNRKISGLNPNKYYMVVKETDVTGAEQPGYPKFVTEKDPWTKGQLIANTNLDDITRITGGTITTLTNKNTYTVKSATNFPDGTSFAYKDNGVDKSADVNPDGILIIPVPTGDLTLEGLSPDYDGYDVMAVAFSPANLTLTNFGSSKKNISAWTPKQLESAGSTVDYVFFKKEPLDFKVLRVRINSATDPTVESVTVAPPTANVVKGETQQFTASVTGTNNPEPTVTWSIDENHATGTDINESGLLTVASNEIAETLTIRARSTVDSGKSGTATVTVTEAPTYGITLTPSEDHPFPSAVFGYSTQDAYSVTVTNSGNQATGDLTVALSGTNSGSFTLSKTTINSLTAPDGTDTFTVRPNDNLAAGTYSAIVTVSGTNLISKTFNVSFEVTVAPTYGITLTPSEDHPFPSAVFSYSTQDAYSVTVTNSGNQATGDLTVALSGTNSGSFTLSKTTINSLTAPNGTDTFTVRPNDNLAVGTYSATVTVSGGNGIVSQSFDVSFTVTEAPTYSIELDKTGTQTFSAKFIGYTSSDLTSLSVKVTNTGTGDTGGLTVALSGTNAGSFTLSATTITSITAGGSTSNAFTVVPKTNLNAGTYTATVTVSGGNGITASFNVSFTVTTGVIIEFVISDASISGAGNTYPISYNDIKNEGKSLNFTLADGTYTGVTWTLGSVTASSGTNTGLTIDSTSNLLPYLVPGTHHLDVKGTKDDAPYSAYIEFTVN